MGTPIRTILDDLDKNELENQINTKADKNQLDSIIEQGMVVARTINFNDGVYEYGRFAAAGTEYDKDTPIEGAFRSANYIPVEGGRTITAYFEASDWNKNNVGYAVQIVQYDASQNILVTRTTFQPYTATTTGFTLNAGTAYIRICMDISGTVITTPLDEIELALYYIEDAVKEYIPYTVSELSYFVRKNKVNGLEPLKNKKIVYDGDSICESRTSGTAINGGAYPKIIADYVGGSYVNEAKGGARLCTNSSVHSVVDNLENLPTDGDLYCFEGGINDYYGNTALGTCTQGDFTGNLDESTVCGALETIFRYALNNFVGKPVCFVIAHKIQKTAYTANTAGHTFKDYRDAIINVCEKYSIPYYDAFATSGLNGWNNIQNNAYLTAGSSGVADGTHPNEEAYKRYYVPQLLELFRKIMPIE